MFKQITRDDSIFQSEAFQKDSMAFSVMESILNNKVKYLTPKVFSNGKNCAIVNSDPNHPVIVWTSDDFKEKAQLYDFIKKEFCDNAPFKIMSKKNFYDGLVEHQIIPELQVQTLGVYNCPKLNDIQYIGHPDQAKTEEIDHLAQMIADFGKETGENPNAQAADCMEAAQKYISNPLCFVWRDKNEKIVAMAKIKTGDATYSRISQVFTKTDERGKSYAKMLVHYLTSQALKEGRKVMLFTNYDYRPSNRCYQKVGYKLNGVIVNFIPLL